MKNLLHNTPELALFVCLALGFAVGKIKFWKISLGGVAGTLIVAILIGLWSNVSLNEQVKNIAFAMFIFTLGYMSGPSFFASLNRKSMRYGVFTAIECVSILTIVAIATVLLKLDVGTAAGMLAGGATESAVVGTATDSIGKLDASPEQITTWQNNVGTAYSISYIMGLITIVLMTSQVFPSLMRINLRDEADKLWRKLGGGSTEEGAAPALPDLVGRAHQVTTASGRTVAQLETSMAAGVTVERIHRGTETVEVTPQTKFATGDVVLMVGRRDALINGDDLIGPEVLPSDGMDLELDQAEAVLTAKTAAGKTLGELREQIPVEQRRGVYLTGVSRMEHPLPLQPGTELHTGDVLKFNGTKKDLGSFLPKVGFKIDPNVKADFIFIGIGVALGILIGKGVLTIGGIPLSLGTGGGCLLTGLFFGWLRARKPTFGQYHPAAASVIKDLGLATFICAVGLSSGPTAIKLIKQFGIALPITGILITLVPATISLFVAWKLMKLEAPLALGAVCGQQCSTPAITSVQTLAGNTTPLMSYTIVYALSNVTLPLMGPIVVAMANALQP